MPDKTLDIETFVGDAILISGSTENERKQKYFQIASYRAEPKSSSLIPIKVNSGIKEDYIYVQLGLLATLAGYLEGEEFEYTISIKRKI